MRLTTEVQDVGAKLMRQMLKVFGDDPSFTSRGKLDIAAMAGMLQEDVSLCLRGRCERSNGFWLVQLRLGLSRRSLQRFCDDLTQWKDGAVAVLPEVRLNGAHTPVEFVTDAAVECGGLGLVEKDGLRHCTRSLCCWCR